MKKAILTMVMMFSVATAFGTEFLTNTASFTISTFSNFGGRVFYNCDSVEDQVERVLTKMGAQVEYVRCTGGLDRWGRMHTAAHVRTSFITANSDDFNSLKTKVTIKEHGNCHLNNEIVRSVVKYFEVENLNMRSCFRTDSNTHITMDVVTRH